MDSVEKLAREPAILHRKRSLSQCTYGSWAQNEIPRPEEVKQRNLNLEDNVWETMYDHTGADTEWKTMYHQQFTGKGVADGTIKKGSKFTADLNKESQHWKDMDYCEDPLQWHSDYHRTFTQKCSPQDMAVPQRHVTRNNAESDQQLRMQEEAELREKREALQWEEKQQKLMESKKPKEKTKISKTISFSI